MNTPQKQSGKRTVLVTGGCGFIGSNFLNLFVPQYAEWKFVNVDALTYAANPSNIEFIANSPNYFFETVDIRNPQDLEKIFLAHTPDWVIHFAAESHVDRSIFGPLHFFETNVMGTVNLLEACRQHWRDFNGHLFHHVSTDEVYGSLATEGAFSETTAYAPSSPYSASKAASDHIVRAYHRTYGLPVIITNCSNNYGPYQFPEKLIPLMIMNAIDGKQLPIYGRGENIRDWLYVTDHCEGIMAAATNGRVGETYNIGGGAELANIEVVQTICRLVAEHTDKKADEILRLIKFVSDRPGHDFRYAIDSTKIRQELSWQPKEDFESGIRKTVAWYLNNALWINNIRSGEYKNWIVQNYEKRTTP